MIQPYDIIETDILILGSGGAGQMAALHAFDSSRQIGMRILMAIKGLLGKSGCTRMVQGGYNAVLNEQDSLEKHLRDTIQGGQWINDQELAHILVSEAPASIIELENRYGCFFDRNPDGTVHQKPFAAQSFDRTVHRGDQTGIEIINRLTEQVMRREIRVFEECRALELLRDGDRVSGVLLVDVRTGRFLVVHARATLLATGGGPTCYRIYAPSADKSLDGIAMGLRAGAELMDMEMVQFHPTGLLAGESLITGTVLEEGLRGVGGMLLNGLHERFMEHYDPERLERSTRDVVARSSYLEIQAGRGTDSGGVLLDVSHLGAEFVRREFPGMYSRCRDAGYDLGAAPVEVSPTAHFIMGGVRIDPCCRTSLAGLYAAGEDASGVHGANRLGGNGVAESIVFGGIAGETLVEDVDGPDAKTSIPEAEELMEKALRGIGQVGAERITEVRSSLREMMWNKVGLVRSADDLAAALDQLRELRERAERASTAPGLEYNLDWQMLLDVRNCLDVAEAIAASAIHRRESRGSHYRADFPGQDDGNWLVNILARRDGDSVRLSTRPVALTRMKPESAE
jgi:succinate dehydrogenase/fumarate reductase flavoprotein subunit